jgi:hypothetical protein
MTKRQTEEFAKLYMDIGKLTLGSLALGFFQINIDPVGVLFIIIFGLTGSMGFFIMGLKLFKEVK